MVSNRGKRGQFIIIAVMLVAVMIVSMGALMHNAITYYKHEPWEEYSTLIGDIEINSRKLVELSLASYTNSLESITIIETNLAKWEEDLADAYPNRGITLASSGAQMLNSSQTGSTATSKAQASFTLNILSIGLEGYTFNVLTSLTLSIKSVTPVVDSNMTAVVAVVTSETGMPVTDLDKTNFKVENATSIAVSAAYDSASVLEYGIIHNGSVNSAIEVYDQRGICVAVSQT